jgi:hypothetical protein
MEFCYLSFFGLWLSEKKGNPSFKMDTTRSVHDLAMKKGYWKKSLVFINCHPTQGAGGGKYI